LVIARTVDAPGHPTFAFPQFLQLPSCSSFHFGRTTTPSFATGASFPGVFAFSSFVYQRQSVSGRVEQEGGARRRTSAHIGCAGQVEEAAANRLWPTPGFGDIDGPSHPPPLKRTAASAIMASNGAADSFAVPNVLAAMLTMRSGDADKKKIAVDYLGRFQKSVCLPHTAAIRCPLSAT
jgi:hypothetical protein